MAQGNYDDSYKLKKIGVVFRRSFLQGIMKILTMNSDMYRSFKAVKNINKVFSNLDMDLYKKDPELEAYIWCINYYSSEWLKGVMTPELIAEMATRNSGCDSLRRNIIEEALNDSELITPQEAKETLDIVTRSLQDGYIYTMKDELIQKLEDFDITDMSSVAKGREDVINAAKAITDVYNATNVISDRNTFDTNDSDSIDHGIESTIESLKESTSIFKTGITRLNTLLSPGYLNGRLYVYEGLPGSGKSVILLKSALDIRRYNRDFKAKTKGMTPCVLYITMENSLDETIERLWNMMFDDPIIHYSKEEAREMLKKELGIIKLEENGETEVEVKASDSLLDKLNMRKTKKDEMTIHIVIKYFKYREISTSDLYTIIQDLEDEKHMEVVALILDYIKRIEPSIVSHDSVKLELNRITNELKALAVSKNIPVITAHQLNRAAAATIDAAVRQGQGDVTKLVGRENTGDALIFRRI